jgi:hypothetical protein
MRAAWYERDGPASEVLTVGDMEALRPDPGEVLVRVRASGVSPGEVKKRSGWVGLGIGYPRTARRLPLRREAHEAVDSGRADGRIILHIERPL